MNESKSPVYLATGLLLGLGLGLLISLVLFPSRSGAGSPAQLNEKDKSIYRDLVAQAYAVNDNLNRAAARIQLLGDADPANQLAADAQRMLAEGKPLTEAEIPARLASALKSLDAQASPGEPGEDSVLLFTPAPATATAEAGQETETPFAQETSPQALSTNRPTPSPAPTLGAPFALAERLVVCEQGREPFLIEVEVQDHAGKPVPGIRIDISWQNGEEYFFTGLIQSVDPGYADYTMSAGTEYTLRVGEGGEQVRGLTIPDCNANDGSKYPGSISLRFTQP